MKITFHISYKTVWGESLHVLLYRANASANERKINISLTTQDGENWTGEIQLLLKQPAHLAYYYEVRNGARLIQREWNVVTRHLHLNPAASDYFLQDQWRNLPQASWLYSSAATDVFLPREHKPDQPLVLFPRTIILHAQTPQPGNGKLFLCGSDPKWGAWNPDRALPLQEKEYNEWEIAFSADELTYPIEYKFIVKNSDGILWEQGANRRLCEPDIKRGQVWEENDLRPQFGKENFLRVAGTVIPVFSLRSQDSWGTGDFGDLKLLVDWAEKTGQHIIQLLPLHDTTLTRTWRDSYPYKAISIYALHPLYADMRLLPAPDKHTAKRFETQRAALNALPQLDYEAALQLKTERLKGAFRQEGKQLLSSPSFARFYEQNRHWLDPYAMFCVLRDRYRSADFNTWSQFAFYSRTDMERFCMPGAPDYNDVSFWYYVQYLLHSQLLEAAQYARRKGVILKGDIPIGVAPHSVEAWTERNLFHLDAQAGAPPDDFSATGQNWGFPTYNWKIMALDNYHWWQQRFSHMAQYFDAYRMDHLLGFFRIWEIPSHSVQGLLGQFSPALPLSSQEIERFGLPFNTEYLRPYISEQVLFEKLGDLASFAKKNYLTPAAGGLYDLLPEYDTQRKIEAAFARQTDEKSLRLRNGLYALAANVLFVSDHRDPTKYHPRIAALRDSAFRALNANEKEAFTRLYNEYFYRRHNQFWQEEALKKLPALTQATRMLPCAEDLGMIPDCVPYVLDRLQILSLEIQRMPKHAGETFADTSKYPYLSVATPSTHDMSVLRGWWKETPALTQRFWNEVLGHSSEAPAQADTGTCEKILQMHLESPSMLALISWQDWTSINEHLRTPDPHTERINIPADPQHYWRYRMAITLEQLLRETAFNDKIHNMIRRSKR